MRQHAKTLIALLALACNWAGADAQGCSPVQLLESAGGQNAYVNGTGKFCLTQDIKQKRVFDVHAGGFKSLHGQPLLTISCSQSEACPDSDTGVNYDIDLKGHAMVGQADGMKGVDNQSGGLGVQVRNGVISVKGNASIGVFLRGGRMSGNGAGLPDSTGRAPFMTTSYLIEQLAIRAGGQGVNMSGASNVLRNSVIDVDGHTAAYLFGPGSIVENNTFIVRARGNQKAHQAALQLRDADRAVVRNNRFIFKGNWLRRGGVAISLLDSANVTVLGNTFEGFEREVLLDGATTAGQQGGR